MKMILTTGLAPDVIEPALNHWAESSNKKTFNRSNCSWVRIDNGKYECTCTYFPETSWTNKMLRNALADGLRKKDPSGMVELIEEAKGDVPIVEKKKRFKFF